MPDDNAGFHVDDLQLLTHQQTMTAVNHLVLNELLIIRSVVEDFRRGKTITARHVELIDQAISDTIERLDAISTIERYETQEIIRGLRMVTYLFPPEVHALTSTDNREPETRGHGLSHTTG